MESTKVNVSPSLTDYQRQKAVLKSSRLLDHETFIQKFRSCDEPDSQLIEDFCRYNNEKAFTDLYKRHKTKMLAYLYSILHNWEDAKDVLHNSWEVVLNKFSKQCYKEEQDFEGWFRSICYRQASVWKRERRSFLYGSDHLPDHADASYNAEERLENMQCETLLHNAMNRLTDNERQIIILRIYDNMPFHEIAVMRHITANAARSIYCKVVKKLKKALC